MRHDNTDDPTVKGGRATQTAAFKIKAKLFRYRYSALVYRVVER